MSEMTNEVTITELDHRILTECFGWMWQHHQEVVFRIINAATPPPAPEPIDDDKGAA